MGGIVIKPSNIKKQGGTEVEKHVIFDVTIS